MEKCSRCQIEFPDLNLTDEQKEGCEIFCDVCYTSYIQETYMEKSDKIADHIDPRVLH